jgi:hypothetical protein
MADLAKSGTPSLATILPPNSNKLTLIAGEAIAAGDACYIKSDGKLWRSTGAAATAPAVVDGFALSAAAAGEALTVAHGVRLEYGSGMTPGTPYYLSATAGALADAASTGGTVVIARAVDATRLEVRRSW